MVDNSMKRSGINAGYLSTNASDFLVSRSPIHADNKESQQLDLISTEQKLLSMQTPISRFISDNNGSSADQRLSVEPVDISAKEIIEKQYNELMQRLSSDSQDPDAILQISWADVNIMAEYLSMKYGEWVIQPFMSDQYKYDFEFADVLYGFADRKFNLVGDGLYAGGDINYLAVGVLAGRYGYGDTMINALVVGWNVNQYMNGEGVHNLYQIDDASAWARYGANYYENRSIDT
ncbi:MAG: hypothetical protein JAY84_20040 [Candidatus Thiodiazotropha taylori]|nr:hypothetical protein [Candidatus Thiodiazotropha taylori]MCG8070139.1 hypothetical protein [Candidatus Thiodiazotropha taylori]